MYKCSQIYIYLLIHCGTGVCYMAKWLNCDLVLLIISVVPSLSVHHPLHLIGVCLRHACQLLQHCWSQQSKTYSKYNGPAQKRKFQQKTPKITATEKFEEKFSWLCVWACANSPQTPEWIWPFLGLMLPLCEFCGAWEDEVFWQTSREVPKAWWCINEELWERRSELSAQIMYARGWWGTERSWVRQISRFCAQSYGVNL